MELISLGETALRLLVATLLGASVGFERERNEWTAGLRTHALVAIGSALAMIVSTYGFNDVLLIEGFDVDPSRVAAQVISGVGFLGAGTILFLKQEVVKGLTTAAGLWSVAAVGLACGGGMYAAASIGTVLLLFVLAGVKGLEKRYLNREQVRTLSVKMTGSSDDMVSAIQNILERYEVETRRMTVKKDKSTGQHGIVIVFSKFAATSALMKILADVQQLENVVEVDL